MVILKTVNSNSGIKMKNTYGDESYLKFPEYGILHYIKKIFGETELKDFTDFAFDSTGNYWKVNEKGDLIDDGNISIVFDSTGKEVYSGSTGRQGSLEAWLSLDNAFTSLLKPAGYEWDGKQWSKNPGKIDRGIIEKALKQLCYEGKIEKHGQASKTFYVRKSI